MDKQIVHVITENWEEELLRNIVGDEEIASLKYPETKEMSSQEYIENVFDPKTEFLEITIKRVPK